MAKAIFKYKLAPTPEATVVMPKGARIMSTAVQYGEVCAWALVDKEQTEMVSRRYWIVGTGHDIGFPYAGATFVGTVLMLEGSLVWHIFFEG